MMLAVTKAANAAIYTVDLQREFIIMYLNSKVFIIFVPL